jgi:hypothetical protein
LQQTLDTKTVEIGRTVSLADVMSADGSGEIVSAWLAGTVTKVARASQGQPAQLQITFTTLRLVDGRTYAVDGAVSGMQVQTKSNAVKEVGGTVAGMLVGNAIFKRVGLNGGGIVGAAGGYLIAKNSRENMTGPAGSIVNVELRSARRQAR